MSGTNAPGICDRCGAAIQLKNCLKVRNRHVYCQFDVEEAPWSRAFRAALHNEWKATFFAEII